jgi:hypothetical protein
MPVAETIESLVDIGVTVLTRLVVIVIFTPIFVFPSVAVAILGFYLGNLYLRAQLSVKREMRYANGVIAIEIPFTYVAQQCTFPITGAF